MAKSKSSKPDSFRSVPVVGGLFGFLSGLVSWVRGKFTRRRFIVLVVIVLIIVGLRFRSSRQPKFEVETVKVESGSLVESISASGKVSANKAVNLAFPTSGKIAWLGVKEGDMVVKGQALASLDKTVLNSTFQKESSDLRDAQATLLRVHDDVKNHDSDETFTQKETRTAAEVANDKAYEDYLTAQYNLNNATLISPFAGIVTSFASGLSEGVNVLSTVSVFSVVNPDTIYFLTEVNEVDVAKLKVGQKVELILDAHPDEVLEGEILTVGFGSVTTSTGGTAYKVKVTLPGNENLRYRMGMNGDAEFVVSEKESVLTVPVTAVSEENGNSFVWVVDSGAKAKKVGVETGTSSIDDIEITSGLEEGQSVILRPPGKIEEGDRVSITGQEEPSKQRGGLRMMMH